MAFKGWKENYIKTSKGQVKAKAPLIVSASRATDIPAFFGDWLVAQFERGYLWRKQPYTGKYTPIDLSEVAFVVFWTKDPHPFLKHLDYFNRRNIDYYFLYTLNNYEQEGYEPGLPDLNQRIETFQTLAGQIGKERVLWRFDPIMKVRGKPDVSERIGQIAKQLSGYTDTLIFSFLQLNEYKKVQRNFVNRLGLASAHQQDLLHTPIEQLRVVENLKQLAYSYSMHLASCADPSFVDEWQVTPSACIDAERISNLAGNHEKLQHFLLTGEVAHANKLPLDYEPTQRAKLKDRNQRKLCRCIYSQDIGQYNTCKHGCVYCYACRYPTPT